MNCFLRYLESGPFKREEILLIFRGHTCTMVRTQRKICHTIWSAILLIAKFDLHVWFLLYKRLCEYIIINRMQSKILQFYVTFCIGVLLSRQKQGIRKREREKSSCSVLLEPLHCIALYLTNPLLLSTRQLSKFQTTVD